MLEEFFRVIFVSSTLYTLFQLLCEWRLSYWGQREAAAHACCFCPQVQVARLQRRARAQRGCAL